LIYAATRPDTFRVERSASVKAPPERVFALINDLHNFNQWNPYEKKDPALKGTYGAARSGQGAAYAWESDKVGVGSMEIVHTVPASKVTMRLDFIKPFEAHNTAEFTLRPQADATTVTWSMEGGVPYFAKLVHLVFNMDKMVGKDFEEGLVNLKTLADGAELCSDRSWIGYRVIRSEDSARCSSPDAAPSGQRLQVDQPLLEILAHHLVHIEDQMHQLGKVRHAAFHRPRHRGGIGLRPEREFSGVVRSNGLMKSSRMVTLEAGTVWTISMLPRLPCRSPRRRRRPARCARRRRCPSGPGPSFHRGSTG